MTAALVDALADWDQPTTSAQGARRYDQIAQATSIVRQYIYPWDVRLPDQRGDKSRTRVREAFALLRSCDKLGELHRDFADAVESQFHVVREDIDAYLATLELNLHSEEPDEPPVMQGLLDRVYFWQQAWGGPLRLFDDDKLLKSFSAQFQSLLFSSLPAEFHSYLFQFFAQSLAAVPQPDVDAAVFGGPPEAAPASVPPPSPYLHSLNVVRRYATTLMRVACDDIAKIAAEEAGAGWTERRLAQARARVSASLVSFMTGVFDRNESVLRSVFSRFDYHLCKAFFDLRTDELFDMIVEYPESVPALEDLRDCMFKIDQRDQVVEKLRAANLKRLLQPGAETKDVITQYISTIHCLRILDPPGVLLHKVAEPIRRHLKDRPDTIRCIVASLVEDEQLQDENDPLSAEPLAATNDNSVENFADPKWEPEPYDAAPEFRTGKNSDIVSTLVSIYETREAIVKELQSYLATRLLAVKDYDSVKELRTIELLKIRFGEEALHVCDVMLKDMSDSKRINDHVHGDIRTLVQPLIISRMFWPAVPPTMLKLTPKLQRAQADYEAAFHHFKPDKHLRWLQELGTVSVHLQLKDRAVAVDVTPLQASVAELFEQRPQWTETDLSKELGVEASVVRAALGVWAGHGVMKGDEDGNWRLLEVIEEGAEAQRVTETAPTFQRADKLRAEEKGRMYWTYIKGVLSNLGPQNISTLQRMLTLDRDYDMSTEELTIFLSAAKREGFVLQRRDGIWLLPE